MNRHENDDPRRPERERVEEARQARLTRRLTLAIGVLVGTIAVGAWRGWFW